MWRDACLYKQSQSHRLGAGREGRDIPPIHYSIIPPFQSDGERAKQSQSHRLGAGREGRDVPPIHYSIIPPFQSDGERAKQSQLEEV
jgi:hypothetical protein